MVTRAHTKTSLLACSMAVATVQALWNRTIVTLEELVADTLSNSLGAFALSAAVVGAFLELARFPEEIGEALAGTGLSLTQSLAATVVWTNFSTTIIAAKSRLANALSLDTVSVAAALVWTILRIALDTTEPRFAVAGPIDTHTVDASHSTDSFIAVL